MRLTEIRTASNQISFGNYSAERHSDNQDESTSVLSFTRKVFEFHVRHSPLTIHSSINRVCNEITPRVNGTKHPLISTQHFDALSRLEKRSNLPRALPSKLFNDDTPIKICLLFRLSGKCLCSKNSFRTQRQSERLNIK